MAEAFAVVRAMSTDLRISLEQYDLMVRSGAFDGEHRQRVELIRGEIRPMSPIGSLHEVLVDWLNEWSVLSVPRRKVRVRVQNSIGLAALESAPEPDIAWVARRNYATRRPQAADVFLIVEVADSSLAYDLGDKAELYAQSRIRDYWVVDALHRRVTIFRDPKRGRYASQETLAERGAVSSLAFPKIKLAVAELFQEAGSQE
jgi:Uma2 family endonuclease